MAPGRVSLVFFDPVSFPQAQCWKDQPVAEKEPLAAVAAAEGTERWDQRQSRAAAATLAAATAAAAAAWGLVEADGGVPAGVWRRRCAKTKRAVRKWVRRVE